MPRHESELDDIGSPRVLSARTKMSQLDFYNAADGMEQQTHVTRVHGMPTMDFMNTLPDQMAHHFVDKVGPRVQPSA